MTNSQSDRLDMYKGVISFIEGSLPISGTRPGLIAGKDQLKTTVTGIESKAGLQSGATAGAFDDKNELQEALCQQLYIVTSGTKGYAASISNNTLQEQMNYSISELRRIGDETVVPFAGKYCHAGDPSLRSAADGIRG